MSAIHTSKNQIAVERGKRLRICRGYTGLNIIEFCKKYDFNTITFGRWERGNKVSLNEKNADRVCYALLQEGIVCDRSWLLEGLGEAPRERSGLPLFQGKELDVSSATFSALLIFSEMEVFQNNNPHAVTSIVDTPAMTPFYDIGDYVGGLKLDVCDYALANNKKCLIKLSPTSKLIVRSVQWSGHKIILTTINSKIPVEPLILDEKDMPEILAPIVFHRKSEEWVRKKV